MSRLELAQLAERRVTEGVCVRCGQPPWGGDGLRIVVVAETPAGASSALRDNLRNARVFEGKPLCDECSPKLMRKPGGPYANDPEERNLIRFGV